MVNISVNAGRILLEEIMALDPKLSADFDELKKNIEKISGRELEATPEHLIRWIYPVATYAFEDGHVTSYRIFFPGKSCAAARLLDVAGSSTTGGDGTRTFRLSDYIWSDRNSFAAPVNVVVTPNASQPVYATRTHALVANPNAPGDFNDLEIKVSTWSSGGAAAPGVAFDWRCRIVALPIIL
jgi:hypothetical protein